jgi:hypothetical protein
MTTRLSFHDAVETLRRTDVDRLAPHLRQFVEDGCARLCEDPDGPAQVDVRKRLEVLLRAVGAPWFAFGSFVLPGWSWSIVSIARDRRPEAQVAWLRLRLSDFAREIERLQSVYDATDPLVGPAAWVRRVCTAELPRLVATVDHAFEAYDVVHQSCELMLDAARLPTDEAARAVVDGFVGSKLPTAERLARFVEELADAVSLAFSEAWGPLPTVGPKLELVAAHRALAADAWLEAWLADRLARRAAVDEEALAALEGELADVRARVAAARGALDVLFHDYLDALERKVAELEEQWVGADDRESVVTGNRLDFEIGLRKLEAASVHARWDAVAQRPRR